MSFEKQFRNSDIILTEGALFERLKKEFTLTFDPHINHAGAIYDSPEALGKIYREYIEIARDHNTPIMLMTPTRKVNKETHVKSAHRDKNILLDACDYLRAIRNEYADFAPKIFLGGLLGCRGDAYRADDALETDVSYEFHKTQVAEFAKGGVDFLFAGIMPSVKECIGMACAMGESGIPYIISFMVRKDGCLIDGTSISEAIRTIDESVSPKPLCYMTNCIHPTNLKIALASESNKNSPYLNRFVGIQANASSFSPEELNNCGNLHQEDFDTMITEIINLVDQYNFKIVGGCCGTDGIFIQKLSQAIRM